MSERRAISTIALITLSSVGVVLGLGFAAHSARAATEPAQPIILTRPLQPPASATLGVLGLEPGAIALMGASGVVALWPGARRGRRGEARPVDNAPNAPQTPHAGEGGGRPCAPVSSAA
ncbi:MAG: hypothetical protein IBJ10_07490 [Phycisphaerales bacterium]|nr:hypothetical protein [Phycisphaerales bacterium]